MLAVLNFPHLIKMAPLRRSGRRREKTKRAWWILYAPYNNQELEKTVNLWRRFPLILCTVEIMFHRLGLARVVFFRVLTSRVETSVRRKPLNEAEAEYRTEYQKSPNTEPNTERLLLQIF